MGCLSEYDDNPKEEIEKIKISLETARHNVGSIIERGDSYYWQELKYFMADMIALETLLDCAVMQVKDILENHCQDEEEEEEE